MPVQSKAGPSTGVIAQVGDAFTANLLKALNLSPTLLSTCLCTSLAANVVTLIGSAYLVTTAKGRYFVYSIPLISSLTSLVAQAAILIHTYTNLEFDFTRAYEFVNRVVDAQMTKQETDSKDPAHTFSNAVDYGAIIKYSMKLVVMIVTVGMTNYGWTTADINSILTLNDKTSKFSSDALSFVNDMLLETGLADFQGKAGTFSHYQNLISETQQLVAQNPSDFVTDTATYAHLGRKIVEVSELLLKPLNSDEARQYTTVRNILASNQHKMVEIKAAVDTILAGKSRITAYGFLFEGTPGIGKSELAMHVMERIGKIMNFNPSVYDFKTTSSGKYSRPYGNESFGIYNEFANSTGVDDQVKSLNSIISSDPYSFESAFVKEQPCKLRVVSLTSNQKDYSNLLKTLPEATLCALFSRLVRVRVTDKQFQGRYSENGHRMPDFSHLTLEVLTPTAQQPATINHLNKYNVKATTVDDLIQDMTRQACKAEIHYWKKVIEALDPTDIRLPGIHERRSFCQGILDGITTSNAEGNYCVVRLQGGVGSFKTTTANETANRLAETYQLPIRRIKYRDHMVDTSDHGPSVYIFDDFDFEDHAQAYMDFINAMNPNSIVIIATNHIVEFEPVSRFGYFHFNNAWDSSFQGLELCQLFNPTSSNFIFRILLQFLVFMFFIKPTSAYQPTDQTLHIPIRKVPGIVRRVGFSTRVLDNGIVTNLPQPSGLCFTVRPDGSYHTTSRAYYADSIPDMILDHYASFITSHKITPVVTGTPPVFSPDVTIEIKDFEQWKDAVKSANGYAQMYLQSDHPAGRVSVKQGYEMQFLQQAQLSYWIIPNLENLSEIRPIIRTLCNTLRNSVPGITATVTSSSFCYSFVNNVIYESTQIEADKVITADDNILTYNGREIPAIEIFQFSKNPQLLPQLNQLKLFSGSELAHISYWIKTHDTWKSLPIYLAACETVDEAFKKQQNTAKHPVLAWLSQHTTIALVITALLTTFSVWYVSKKIYTWLASKTTSNTTYDDDNYDNYQQKYIQAVQRGEVNTPDEYANRMAKNGVPSQEIQGWKMYNDRIRRGDYDDDDINSNSAQKPVELLNSIVHLMANDDDGAAKTLLQTFNKKHKLTLGHIQQLTNVKSNAISPAQEISSHSPVITTITATLRKACLRVNNDTRGGVCYGLLVKQNYFVTVSHLFDNGDELSVNWTMNSSETGRRWKAKVLFVNRDLDLAICAITEKNFPSSNNIIKLMYDSPTTNPELGTAYFIRPLATGFVYAGDAVRHRFSNIRRTDPQNPRYKPVDYYSYTWTQMLKTDDIFSRGDCGLPLVCVIKGKATVMAIHNGFSNHSTAYFSPLTRGTFESLLTDTPITVSNSSEPSLLYKHKAVLDLPAYNTAIKEGDIGKETHWDNHRQHMNILGHSQALYFFTNPNFSKKNFHNAQCKLPNESLPSAYNRSTLTLTAASVLPKDKKNRPHPLIAQALKFGDNPSVTFDEDTLEHAFQIQSSVYKSTLAPCSILRPAAALNGIVGESLKPVVLKTSAGPDMKRCFKISTKEPLIRNINADDPDKTPWYVWTDHEAARKIQEDMTAIFDHWSGGVQTSVVSKDNPKVELLPIEKVRNEGKVRLFCELDLAVNLVLRRLMGSFISQVNEAHFLLNLKTGINPYRDIHWAAKNFDQDADIFGFDVKRMDKYLPAALVHKVFQLMEYCLDDNKRDGTTARLYETAAYSITDRVHVIEGILYSVKRGNPSGLTGTNHINALALELIIIYGYIQRQKFLNPLNFVCSNVDYMQNIKGLINGDNGYIVVPKWLGYTETTIQLTFKQFGMEVLFDKSALKGVEWCGREINKVEGFIFPALRREAITRQIWWVNTSRIAEYPMQALMVQFEASLHDKKFFDAVQHDIRIITKTLSLDPNSIVYIDYHAQRAHFKKYIAGTETSPVLTGQVPNCLKLHLILQPKMESVNWVGRYNERCQRDKVPTAPSEHYKQDTTTNTWIDKVTDQGFVGEGSGDRKAVAKNGAFCILYENRFGADASTTSNADRKLHKHNVRYTCDSSETSDKNTVRVYADDKLVLEKRTAMSRELVSATVKSHLRDTEAWNGAFYASSQRFSGSSSGSSNGDNPNLNKSAIAPVVPQGNRTSTQTSAQPTSTAGQMEPPAMPLLAAGGIAKMTVLNPYGPLNRMTEGGITVDLPTLIYSQMIDGNQTYHVTDSMPAGTIIAQIPWDPTSEFVNKFIRAYALQHGRANGSIKFRITMVSNQTFSGGVIVCWVPTKYKGETLDRAEAQKYSYTVLTTTMPSAENFILNDARQYEYYRKIPITDIDSVPHLVIAVHLPLRSPLKEGVSCDIVVGSQLCSPMDQKLYMAQPFEFAEPIVRDIGPTPSAGALNGQTIGQVFPSYSIKRLNMALDGRSYLPSLQTIINGEEMYYDLRTMLPCLAGGTFPDNLTRRLVSSHVTTSTIGNQEVRQVFVITRCTPNEEQAIAQSTDFIDTANGDDWLTKCKNMSWLRSIIPINVARTNSTPLNLYTKDSTTIDLVQQTSFVGLRGQGLIQCYKFSCSHNTLSDMLNCGIPNLAQPAKTIIPHNPVLGPMDTSDGLLTLPPFWASLVFTSQSLGTVTGNNEIAPTTISDPVFPKFFQDRSTNLTDIECLQFKLLEPTTQTVIAVVRYLHTSDVFIVRPVDGINYRLYQDNANNLIFDEFGVVRTTSGLSGTDTTGWLTRFPTAFFNGRALTTSNAFVAAVPETVLAMDAAMGEMGEAVAASSETAGGAELSLARRPEIPEFSSEPEGSESFSHTSNTANFNYNNFQTNYYKFGGFGRPNDSFKHWMMYGVLPPLIASNFSNGNAITGPAHEISGNIQAQKNRDFASRQSELDRQHQLVMQDNQNSFQNQEQSNSFAHENDLEHERESFTHNENQSNYAFQRGQQSNLFQHQDTMQSGVFGHENEMQSANFAQQEKMEGTQFVHGLINTATGGAFGLANTVVGKVGDALLEHQHMNDQSKLMAQNANLQIQQAGQTSQSMQIAGAK